VLPFLLRRVKEDVLDDLPPRITQDYVCELSSLQQLLYEDFSKSQAHQQLEESLSHPNSHVFQVSKMQLHTLLGCFITFPEAAWTITFT